MELFTATQIAGVALKAAKGSWDVGKVLYDFIKAAKEVDATMEAFASEVKTLGTACSLIGSRLEGIIKEQDDIAQRAAPDDVQDSLWSCLQEQIAECEKTVSQLKDAVSPGGRDYTKNVTFIDQATRQFRLNMRSEQIVELRSRVQSHTSSLQLMLLVVATTVAYVVPQQADQRLNTQIAELTKKLDDVKVAHADKPTEMQARERDVIEVTNKVINRAETLYAASVASGSVHAPAELHRKSTLKAWMSDLMIIDEMQEQSRNPRGQIDETIRLPHHIPREHGDRAISTAQTESRPAESLPAESVAGELKPEQKASILEWAQQIEAIDELASVSSDSAPQTESSSIFSAAVPDHSRHTATSGSSGSAVRSSDPPKDELETGEPDDEHYSDDEFLLDTATDAMKIGKEAFDQQDYEEASPMLKEALKLVLELPINKQAICDTSEIRYMLGVCAFHLLEPAEAESALLHVLESTLESRPKARTQSDTQHLQMCDTGHLLSQTCVKLGKIARARQYCDNARQGRQRLLGKSHHTFYESMALLCRIEELSGNTQRSKVYSYRIPEEKRKELAESFAALKPIFASKTIVRSKTSDSTDSALSPTSSAISSPPMATLTPEPRRSTAPPPPAQESTFAKPVTTADMTKPLPSMSSFLGTSALGTQSDSPGPSEPAIRAGQFEEAQKDPTPESASSSTPKLPLQPPNVLPAHSSPTIEPTASAFSALGTEDVMVPTEGLASRLDSHGLKPTVPMASDIELNSSSASQPLVVDASTVEPNGTADAKDTGGTIIEPESQDQQNFVKVASSYQNKALRKLVQSRGYTLPGPADEPTRKRWAQCYNIQNDSGVTAALLAGDRSAAIEYAMTHKMTHWMRSKSSLEMPKLHCAALFGELEVVRVLLARGVKPSYKSSSGNLAISFAAGGGYKDIVELLIKAGSSIDNALCRATLYERLDVVDYLLALGVQSTAAWSPHAACVADNPLLLEAVSSDKQVLERREWSRWERMQDLHRTVVKNTKNTVPRSRFDYSFSPKIDHRDGETVALLELDPAGVAVYCESKATLTYLIERGLVKHDKSYQVEGSKGTKTRRSAIGLACMNGSVEALGALLKMEPNSIQSPSDSLFQDPLFMATLNKQDACAKLLVKQGASIDWVVRFAAQTDLNIRDSPDSGGHVALARAQILVYFIYLHLMCQPHRPIIAKYKEQLLDLGNLSTCQFPVKLSGDKTTVNGHILHCVILEGNLCGVKWLIERGSPVDAADSEGRTALLWATVLRRFEIAKWLIRRNASKTQESKDGRSPLSEARKSHLIRWHILFDDDKFDLESPPDRRRAAERRKALAERQDTGSPDDEAVAVGQLVSLGFPLAKAREALKRCNGNLEAATDLLSPHSAAKPKPYPELEEILFDSSSTMVACPFKAEIPQEPGQAIFRGPVFYKDLSYLAERDETDVPFIVLKCTEAIEFYADTTHSYFLGPDNETLVLDAESQKSLDDFKAKFDQLSPAATELTFQGDILLRRGVLKKLLQDFLLSLPIPVIPPSLELRLSLASAVQDPESKLSAIRAELKDLSDAQYATLRVLAVHFYRMEKHAKAVTLSDVTKFACKGIMALREPELSVFEGVMATIIKNVHQIFNYQGSKSSSSPVIPLHKQSADAHLGLKFP